VTLPQGIRPTNQKEYFKVLRHWSSSTPEVAAMPRCEIPHCPRWTPRTWSCYCGLVKNTKHPQNHILLLIHYNVKTCASTIRFYAVQESTGSVDWKLFCSRSALLHVRYTAVLKRLNYTHYIFMIWCQCLISDLLRWWLLPGKRDSMRNAGMATRRAGHISIKKEYESTLVYVSRNKQSLANNDKIVNTPTLPQTKARSHDTSGHLLLDVVIFSRGT